MQINDRLNRPLRDLRLSVIDRCNFRCPYCMPDEQFHHSYKFLEKDQWLSFEEIFLIVKNFVDLGVEKVRLTGGEPLLRPNIDQLILQLSTIKGIKDLALTTNGSLLTEYASKLKKSGLKRLTVSLDSLDPQVFKTLSGSKGNVKDVLNGIDAAKKAGFESIKINAVIQRGINDHTYLDLVRFARQEGYTIRFIEYMDVGNQNHWEASQVVPSQEIIANIHKVFPLESIGGTEDGETSQRFRFLDGLGKVGFISSVSHPFCGTCNRLRLSADGKMYTCLFATQGTDIKSKIRDGISGDELKVFITQIWQTRDDRYSEKRFELQQSKAMTPKVEMYHIGG